MAVDLDEAHVGVVLGIGIFDEFFKELMAAGVLTSEFTFDRDNTPIGPATVTVLLAPPDFVLAAPAGQPPRTELRLGGTIEVRPQGQPDADPINFPLDVTALLTFELRPAAGQAPVLGLRYDGVAEPPAFPITEADVDDLFARPQIADALDGVEINVVGEAIDGLEPILFPVNPPSPDSWATASRLLPAASSSEADAVGVFVASPGGNALPPMTDSPLPALTGLGLIYSRKLLDLAFDQGAAAQIGEEIQGAEIQELTLQMEDTAIHVEGKAKKDSATITFDGPVVPQLIPGTIALYQDASGIDVDVDVPWWADVLLFFRFVPVFWPILIPAALIDPDWDVWAAADEIEDAPSQVRSGLAATLAAQMVALAEGLSVQAEIETVTLESTPDSSSIENGHMLLLAQTFVSTLTETIDDAFYSHQLERFVQYVLESGRLFRASELARLVDAGKIVTPGFHSVNAAYMRADPDNRLGNNLEELFSGHPARPPY